MTSARAGESSAEARYNSAGSFPDWMIGISTSLRHQSDSVSATRLMLSP